MMEVSRRVFLTSAIGACSAGALISPISAHTPAVRYYKAVFDERFEDARIFAAEAVARGTPTVSIRGDITKLFLDDLDRRWKKGPVWLTGLTTPASLFCIDLLARDRGMRLHVCQTMPNMDVVLRVLDGALPRGREGMQLPSSNPADLVFWIIAPGARASAQEDANA